MVTDNRSAGPWQPVEYEGYDPLPIVDLKVHMLGVEDSGNRDGLLRVITEDGTEGWCNQIDAETARVITGQFREHLIGRDALARERLWHDLLMLECFTWPAKKLRGAIDVALWDIAGKRHGLPVWRLLGACRDKVPAYRTQGGTLGTERPEGGDPGGSSPRETQLHLVRRTAARSRLSRPQTAPRSSGDSGCGRRYFPHQLHGYAQMLAMGAVDGIKPPVDMSGGITEILKLAHLTNAFGATIHVQAKAHMWGFSSVNANGAIENMMLLEVHPPFENHTHPAVRNPLKLSDGYVKMPEGPGLGVDLDWDMIENETTEVITVGD